MDGAWGYCQLEQIYDSCGNIRDEGLGLEYQWYLRDLQQCDVNLRNCHLRAGAQGSHKILKILKDSAKKGLACAFLAIPPPLRTGGKLILIAWKVWGCWDDYNKCKANADLNWKRAQDQDFQNEIDRQCQ